MKSKKNIPAVVTMWLGFVTASSVNLTPAHSAAAPTLDQPHIEKALAALQSARPELAAAKYNKGGHRVKYRQMDQRPSQTGKLRGSFVPD